MHKKIFLIALIIILFVIGTVVVFNVFNNDQKIINDLNDKTEDNNEQEEEEYLLQKEESPYIKISEGKQLDSFIKAQLFILPAIAEIWYDDNNFSYTGFCKGENAIRVENQIKEKLETDNYYCNVTENGTSWAVCSQLVSDNSIAICIDFSGTIKEIEITNCNQKLISCD